MNVILQQATAADRPFVKGVFFESQREMTENAADPYRNAAEDRWFGSFYREDETQIILVDEQEAGFLSLIRVGETTNVQCLFLRSEHQGRGIGTNLLRAAIAQAAGDGTRLTIGTEKSNRG